MEVAKLRLVTKVRHATEQHFNNLFPRYISPIGLLKNKVSHNFTDSDNDMSSIDKEQDGDQAEDQELVLVRTFWEDIFQCIYQADMSKQEESLLAQLFYELLWPNGSTLKIHFINGNRRRSFVRSCVRNWERHANIAFNFDSTDAAAHIRILFIPSGSESSRSVRG
jgi:hypothetical protein